MVEDTEMFNAIVSAPTNGAILGDDLAVVNIADATGEFVWSLVLTDTVYLLLLKGWTKITYLCQN